jgi:hypothetical protein
LVKIWIKIMLNIYFSFKQHKKKLDFFGGRGQNLHVSTHCSSKWPGYCNMQAWSRL